MPLDRAYSNNSFTLLDTNIDMKYKVDTSRLGPLRLFSGALLALVALCCLPGCSHDSIEPRGGASSTDDLLAKGEPYDISLHQFPGGKNGTVFMQSSKAYGQPFPALSDEEEDQFNRGDLIFEGTFVQSGPMNTVRPGLGPLYNNNACINCHQNEGRPPFPRDLNTLSGFFLRVSSGNDPIYGPIGTPGFGGQLQQLANGGFKPEVKFRVEYTDLVRTYADGTKVTLRKPKYSVYDTYIPFPSDAMLSPRIGMTMYGLGLLEAIPEETILSYADPDDLDGDGISGRPNYVYHTPTGEVLIGRFGWKANTATVLDQTCQAAVNDMGLTNRIYPTHQDDRIKDVKAPDGKPYELPDHQLDNMVFYARTLAVPAPRGLNRLDVRRGAARFKDLGCDKCHVPSMTTGTSDIKVLSNQVIYAYTDMLLHDMGEELSDHRPDHGAYGHEWKTRPLWGIGLNYTVNNYENYLHDGRARTIEEAILWHGGEAKEIRLKFMALPKQQRDEVITFLKAL